eukprot:PITA_13220
MGVSILKFFVSLLLCLLNLYGEDARNAVAAEDGRRAINIGVIVDKDWHERVSKVAFELAAEDVNKENKLPNSSRLVLHFRFSEYGGQNAVMAASAAVDLLKKQVVAIIGPQTSQEAGFVIDLCNASKVPMISFSVTDPLLSTHRYPYFIRLPHSDAVQADAIAALVEYYGWRKVVAVYADNDYGTGMLPFLTDSLSNVGCEIAYRSAIPANANGSATRAKLSELKDMQITRVFVIHMTSELGTLFFSEARKMGMMNNSENAWIITEGLSAFLDVMNESSIASMEGVLGSRIYIPNSTRLLDFDRRWKQQFIAENPPDGRPAKLNIYDYYAYDAVRMIAQALQRFGNDEFIFSQSPINPNTQLTNLPVFKQGEQLLHQLWNANFSGLSGQLEISEGEVTGDTYEILNVLGKGKGYRPVGYWRSNGIYNSSGGSKLENVTWPGGSTDPPRGWATPKNKPLRIAVPIKHGFHGFVVTETNASGVRVVPEDNPGFVIEIFRAVLKNLPYDVPHEFIPYNQNKSELPGYYDDLIQQVSLSKEFDAAVGDFTILANRSIYVDFTQPYFESGLVMVVPIKAANPSNAWTFVLPFTRAMWGTTGAFFVFTGLVVWLLEHKVNDTFRGKPKAQITTFLWFSFSTLFFSQREKVVSSLARGVIIIWLFVVLILQSSYTANLTAILTAKQMQPTIEDVESLKSSGLPVGYNAGSFVGEYLVEHLGIERKKLKGYLSPQEYANALSSGSVAAIFAEIPYICIFLSQQSGFTIVGETYRTGGLGFAFPKGSPLVSDMSTSVLEVAEGPKSQEIRKKYFNNSTDCSSGGPQENSNRLSIDSFWGLFLITGSASAMGLLIYLGRLLYTYVRHRLPQEQQHFPSTKHLISSRLKSFLNYMDEKKESENAKETSRESDENLPKAPIFGTNISNPPVWESPVSVNTGGHIEEELSGYEDTGGHIEGGGGYIEDTGGPIEGEGGGGVTTGGDPIEEDDDYEDSSSSAWSSRSSSFVWLPGATS